MSAVTRILMVEDAATDAELAVRELRSAGMDFAVERVETRDTFMGGLERFAPHVILSDFTLPGAFDGLAALALAQQLAPELPFIFVSGTIGEERAIEAMRRGAVDYVLKTNLKRLPSAVTRALEAAEERRARRAAESRLRVSEQRFSSFMQHLPGIAFMKDAGGRYVFVNPSFAGLTGRTADEIIECSDREIWPDALAEAFQEHDRQALRSDGVLGRVQQIPAADSEPRSWLIHKFRIAGPDGGAMLVGGVGIDLTERLRAERQAERLARIHRVLSGINSAIVRIRDRQALFDEACRVAVEAGGFELAWIGDSLPGVNKLRPVSWLGTDRGYLDEVGEKLAHVIDDWGAGGRILNGERRFVANDIESDPDVAFREEALARGFRSLVALPLRIAERIKGAFLLYSCERDFFNEDELALLDELAGDISFALEHMEKVERLDYLALYDTLTGLANRALLRDRLESALGAAARTSSTVALVLVDIARFHLINDKFGRQAGDELLRRFAAYISETTGGRERVARVSADCFALIVDHLNGGDRLDDLLRSLCEPSGLPFVWGGQDVRLSLHAGVALYPEDGCDFETLIGNAELALRQAKAGGQRHLRYTPEIHAQRASRLSLEGKLQQALEREQFVLHYQPKIRLRDKAICGLEALIRWNDPEGGLVSPGLFIPLLEESGMIVEVGRWVMRQAVRDCLHWRASGLAPIRVATNISARELQQPDLFEVISELAGAFAPGECGLELEVTESGLMSDVEGNIARFHALRELGLRIAIDDFGTGYSSLSYIARLPADCLKIDRSFVISMAGNPDAFAVVSSIISLAAVLKMEVVAEGVETQEQANMLALLKCDMMQGYLFSRPVPAEEIETMLRSAS
jgi:diguanylate cyclase (GGDEF)-like protein/PAS domain S-box-containing protein